MKNIPKIIAKIAKAKSGAAAVEFALATPLLLTAGLWGVEATNLAITQMRVSQIAVLIADNAARVGENSLLGETVLYESDINDVLYGAHVQAGSSFDLYEHGRVILSSLEVVPDTNSFGSKLIPVGNGTYSSEDNQYIHWQRCLGKMKHVSSYGKEGDGSTGGLKGMGPAGEEVIAFPGEAVMFVEIRYTYQPIVSSAFTTAKDLSAIASFNVRSNRDLSQVYQRDESMPDPIAKCDVYEDTSAIIS